MRVLRALVTSIVVTMSILATVVTAQAPAQPQAVATLNQVMRGILYPNSNVIFDVQKQAPKENAGPDAPLYSGWQAVENSAMALAEAANLVLIPGRLCENGKPVPVQRKDWIEFARGLADAGKAAYKAAQSKNQETVSEATDKVSEACENCHLAYRDVKGGMAARCTPQ